MAPTTSPATATLHLALHAPSGRSASVTIELTHDSPWAELLGDAPLPIEGAFDALAHAVDTLPEPPTRADITSVDGGGGGGASALLPILWLRTCLAPDAVISLATSSGPAPADPRARNAAAFARSLIHDPSLATTLDEALALLDAWSDAQPPPESPSTPTQWNARMRAALERCAAAGFSPVALFGAGTHTRALGETLRDPPVRIACIIDDRPPSAAGPSHARPALWGYPILTPDEALALEEPVRAVVLSANSIEERLWHACGPLRERGIEVIRLYGAAP